MSRLTALAAEIAMNAHGDATDKLGRDYISHHIAGVVNRVAADRGASQIERAVAWLHDVVEDTETTLSDLEVAGFPLAVLTAIDAITRRADESYADYIDRVRANPVARVVKLADNAQNLADNDALAAIDPKRAASLKRRYLLARERLEEAL